LTATSASTADLSKAANITHTGAITGTGYAGYFSKTGISTTNVGLYATASGATNNYAAIFEAGNVGIGTTTPSTPLNIASVAGNNIAVHITNSAGSFLQITDAGSKDWAIGIPDNSQALAFFQDRNVVPLERNV